MRGAIAKSPTMSDYCAIGHRSNHSPVHNTAAAYGVSG
jgi:hypothetical protein